jgi:hypothetical protein
MADDSAQNVDDDKNQEVYSTTPFLKYHHKKTIENVSNDESVVNRGIPRRYSDLPRYETA